MIQTVLRKLFLSDSEVPPAPGRAEEEELQQLAALVPGDVLFDSKRDKSFGLFRFSLRERTVTPIIHSDKHEIYPDVSPCGKRIVFARCESLERTAPAEIWLASIDGIEETLLAKDGTFPTFSADGTSVFFERGRNQLIQVDVITKEETLAFPRSNSSFGSFAVVKPRVSPDGAHVVFTSDKKGRWNTWCANIVTGEFWHVAKACEASWENDSHHILAIKKVGLLGRTGVYRYNAVNPNSDVVSYPVKVQDDGPPFGHEYFPGLAPSGRFLLFSSCPIGQHDHLSAHYQLFVKDLKEEKVYRMTYDGFTNRWPKLIPK